MKYVFMVLLMTQVLAPALAQERPSDHFDGKKFFNPWGANNQKSFFDVLSWKWNSTPTLWPEFVETEKRVLPHPTSTHYVLTWINHATFLLQTGELNILFDPIWSERASPFSFAGPKRVVNPGLSFEELPKIDVIMVSHNHYDHMDVESLLFLSLRDAPQILVPLKDKAWLEGKGIKNLTEMDWWEEIKVGETLITFLPAQHWSARWTWDRNDSLWGSWGVSFDNVKIYHAGDTGYGPHFKMIHERWGSPLVAMLPIGAYEPRWFMKEMHLNPEDAIKAYEDLKADVAVGMHFETFQLTDEGYKEPAEELTRLKMLNPELGRRFFIPRISESILFNRPAPLK
jgi:L-ascorbate metabolism protein UlaG (beta-lactamase superfamily)